MTIDRTPPPAVSAGASSAAKPAPAEAGKLGLARKAKPIEQSKAPAQQSAAKVGREFLVFEEELQNAPDRIVAAKALPPLPMRRIAPQAPLLTKKFVGPKKPADVISEAVKNRKELADIRKNTIAGLKSSQPAATIARRISEGMKTLIQRLYQDGEQALGPPPGNCRYCVAGLGSLGRNESGPYPDYDNFIIMENNSDEARLYFTQLNQYVADRIVRLGEDKGVHLCDGNLNSPYQKYEHRYSNERDANLGGRKELLTARDYMEAGIGDIGDSSPLAGDPSLYKQYMALLFQNNPGEVEKAAVFNIKRNIDGINGDKERSPILAAKLPEIIHIKEDLFRFPQATITALALHYGIEEKNTIVRIEALRKIGVFSNDFAARLTTTIETLLRFRIQAQAAHGEELELVSTGNFASFKKHCEAQAKKLEQAEAALAKEEAKLAALFPKVKAIQAKIAALDQQIASEKGLGKDSKVTHLEKERQKKLLFEAQTHECREKIKELDVQITAAKGQNDAAQMGILEKQKKELQDTLQSLYENNGLREYSQDVMNPKIANNQYAAETGANPPQIIAFSPADRMTLTHSVLPTLRELFKMAEESIKTGKLNPAAFKPTALPGS